MIAETNSMNAVLQEVYSWPREQQLTLARQVFNHVGDASDSEVAPQRATHSVVTVEQIREMLNNSDSDDEAIPTLEELEGILATDKEPPTDAEVEAWLDERRMRKFG